MRSIEGFGPMTQILTHFSGKTCQLGSRVGETGEEVEIAGTPLTVGSRRSLTQPDEICEWRDRRDSKLQLGCFLNDSLNRREKAYFFAIKLL